MSKNRMFHDRPKTRLIVSVDVETVRKIDGLLRHGSKHKRHGNRSEFVRLAIERELRRCAAVADHFDDLCGP